MDTAKRSPDASGRTTPDPAAVTATSSQPAAGTGATPAETRAGAESPPTTGAAAEAESPPAAEAEAETTPATETETETTPATEAGAGAGDGEAGDPEPARPDASEEDRWAAFAPTPTRAPGRFRRAAAAAGRVAGHEWTLACLGGLVLAVVMTWPALRYPRHTLPQDAGDPSLVTWILAWPGHILTRDPANLWHGNAFFPDNRWSLAFTDSLLGYAPLGLIGQGPADAVLRYNLIFVLAHALAFVGAYALARQLGAHPVAGLLVGIAFAYAPWRLAHGGHLHVLSTGGMVLALAMLVRGHDFSLRPRRGPRRSRPGWIIAGWLVAAWQITLGFGVGLIFGYVLALLAVIVAGAWVWRRILRRPRQRLAPVIGANLLGGSIFAGTSLLMALPYLTVVRLYPEAKRSLLEVEIFSPPPRGFFTAPEQSWLWGSLHEASRTAPVRDGDAFWPAEMALLPGFTLLALAAGGLFLSAWSVRTRVVLALGVAATAVLALGTEFRDGAVYRLLYDWLPGWDALRTPGRIILWSTLLLALLAAGAVTAMMSRARELALSRGFPRPGGWLVVLLLVPAGLALVEGIGTTPQVPVPPAPAALSQVSGPVLVLPTDQHTDMLTMMWTTDRFIPIVNGGSGFPPPTLREVRQVTTTFPDAASVDYLRSLGVSTVVVLPDRVVGTPWERALDATGVEFGLVREEIDGSVVFHLDQTPPGGAGTPPPTGSVAPSNSPPSGSSP